MLSVHARERVLAWTLIGAAALVAVVATGDAWQRVGTITPGFNLMANLKTGVADRGGVEPFGLIRAVDGQPVRTHAELRALVEARPAGTTFRYAIERDGQLEEQSVPSRRVTLPRLQALPVRQPAAGPTKPDDRQRADRSPAKRCKSRLFLGFCLLLSLEALLWTDFNTIHRFARLYLVLWAFAPAVFTAPGTHAPGAPRDRSTPALGRVAALCRLVRARRTAPVLVPRPDAAGGGDQRCLLGSLAAGPPRLPGLDRRHRSQPPRAPARACSWWDSPPAT